MLGFVRSHYDWTIVDLGRSLNRLTMDALEEIDEACLVTTLEIPALHQAKQIVQTLLDSGYGKNRLRLILNRAPKRMDITPEELEKMLGVPVYGMLPDDYAGALRMLRGGQTAAAHGGTWASISRGLPASWRARGRRQHEAQAFRAVWIGEPWLP